MKRLVQPELLDVLLPGDPRAIHSRRDLRRINWWMQNHTIMTAALKCHPSFCPRHMTELGAGDGNFLLRVARQMSLQCPNGKVTLLDRQNNVSAQTLAAFAGLGWHAEAVVADALDWPQSGDASEVVIANLFLHHFENIPLSELLCKISKTAQLFVAVEPYRFALPSLVVPLLRLIGCNGVTRHDAVVSIRAGFAGREISALWPDPKNWQLTERRAGLFSHLFIARRCA
jgi:hypothetical protein